MVAHPGDARLYVLDRGRERVQRREAVVHRERDEALLGDQLGERCGLLLAPEDPAAAIDHHDARSRATTGGDVGVELQVVPTDVAVREVVSDFDVRRLARRRWGPACASRRSHREGHDGDRHRDRDSPHRSSRVLRLLDCAVLPAAV